MTTDIYGPVRSWGLTENKREYILVENTFGVARLLYKSDPYTAATGKGEQRGIKPDHARKIKKEIEAGAFTPTPVHLGGRPRHTKAITHTKLEDDTRVARLVIEDGDTLPLTNGGHRFEALGQIRQETEKRLEAAKTDEERAEAEAFVDLVDAQPIAALLLLNGNTQEDFMNLQKGKA